MSLRVTMNRILGEGFPRVSGDEPRYAGASKFATMFSPRERG